VGTFAGTDLTLTSNPPPHPRPTPIGIATSALIAKVRQEDPWKVEAAPSHPWHPRPAARTHWPVRFQWESQHRRTFPPSGLPDGTYRWFCSATLDPGSQKSKLWIRPSPF